MLSSAAAFTLTFNDLSFYATHIIYTMTTLNNEQGTKVKGNSFLSGILRPPKDNFIVRQHSTIEVDSTVNIIQACLNQSQQDSGYVRANRDNCQFNTSSVKELSEVSNTTQFVPGTQFYDFDAAGYSFTFLLTKSKFFKQTSAGRFVSIGEISVWVVIVTLGNIGVLQLFREVFSRMMELAEDIKKNKKVSNKSDSEQP